jgi:hypothetical protein
MRSIARLSPALSLVAMILSVSNAEARITFSRQDIPVTYQPGAGPQAIAVADLNEDRRADVIAVDSDLDEVDVFLNDGSGTIDDIGDSFFTGTGPVAVATGDFNRDARIDLVTVNMGAGTVSVLLSDPEAEFPDEVGFIDDAEDIPVGSAPIGVAVVRLDSDQIDDLAVLRADASVYLLRGKGDGTFTPFDPASVSTGGAGPFVFASGLFNNDSFVDLVISNTDSGDVTVLLGNGNGTFGQASSAAVIDHPLGLVVADLNNDNKQDLTVVSGTDVDVNVNLVYGNGDGTFQTPRQTSQPEVDSTVVAAADLDSDGRIDLAVANPGTGIGLNLFCNQPGVLCVDPIPPGVSPVNGFQLQLLTGGLGGAAAAVQAAVPCGSPVVRGCGDINGDGLPDLVDLDADGNTIRVLLNTSSAEPSPTTPPATVGSATPTQPVTPGVTPVAPSATPTPSATAVFTAAPTAIPVPYTECRTEVGGAPLAVAVADFDGGSADIAVADGQGNQILLLSSHVDRGVSGGACAVLGLSAPTKVADVVSPSGLLADDFNQDGNADLAVVGGTGVTVLFGNGNGSFPDRVPLQTAQPPRSIAAADFNRDGIPDLIVADGTNVAVFLGSGAQSFGPACTVREGTSASLVVTVDASGTDLNADGWADFAFASDQTDFISVFLRKTPGPSPTGTTTPAATPTPGCVTESDFLGLSALPLPANPTAFILGQFEPPGNNLPDLALALSNSEVFDYLGRQGPVTGVRYDMGPSIPPVQGSPTPALSALGTGDVNRDRRADLVVADRTNNDIVVFLAQSDGTFTAIAPIPVGNQPVALAVSDIDGDMKADVVTANAGDGSVSVLLSSRPAPTPIPPSPTQTATSPPTATATGTATPTNTPTSTAVPTGTRTLAPTSTPTTVPTDTPRGVIQLNGSCRLDPTAARQDPGALLFFVTTISGLFVLRRRARSRVDPAANGPEVSREQ